MEFSEEEISLWSDLDNKSRRKVNVIGEAGQELLDTDHHYGRHVLGKIIVLPRSSAMEFQYDKRWACISISDPESPFPEIDSKNRLGILQLKFDDAELPRDSFKLYSEDQAKTTWDFVKVAWDKIDLLMIHCNAGISRSTAIAKSISDVYQPKFSTYYDQLYSPNKLVYEIMKRTQHPVAL